MGNVKSQKRREAARYIGNGAYGGKLTAHEKFNDDNHRSRLLQQPL